ncbi:BatA domain-containing protein [Planctomicrobium piriforme]|uniref:BatA domain-containing protein n=1 Tax=Planctomicrobium piriforme TaxID=1576369 RepID=UPI001C31902C|nr:BatA domain-containing protein [Planctomicrobium piriforme]
MQATFLFALAGLAVPLIIHMIHGWQTRHVQLGTTRFLSELLRETARRRKLKRWLLLSLRLMCVALLALLFARPYLMAEQPGKTRKLAVFLIDQSASMALRSDGARLVDQAVSRVKELAAPLEGESEIQMAFFDTGVRTPPVNEVTTNIKIEELKGPEALFAATSDTAALNWAREICEKSPAVERDVYLFTDLQRSGLDWIEGAAFPKGVRVHVEDLGREGVNNVAVVEALPAKTLLRPGEGTTIAVTLFNYGPFELADVPVQLTLKQGARTVHREEKVSLPPGQATELEIPTAALAAGRWEGAVVVEVEDDLTFDNRFTLALLSARQQQVLLVDGARDQTGSYPESFFLERAISVAKSGETSAESPFAVRTVFYQEGGLPDLKEFDIVVLANVGAVSKAAAQSLAQFVESGGGLLVTTGDRMTPAAVQPLREAGLAPGELLGVSRSTDLPFHWEDWDKNTTLLAPFSDPQSGDLSRLSFSAYSRFSVDPGTRVLARFPDQDPAMTDHALGRGRMVWFLSSCDRSWGDWTRSRLFLPLVHQMLGDLAHLTGGGPIQFHRLDDWEVVLDPQTASEAPRPGIVESQGRWHVFNPNERESETERCTAKELADRFRFEIQDPATSVSLQTAAVIPAVGLESRRDEIWPWCALVLVGLLGLEWFVGNRTTA